MSYPWNKPEDADARQAFKEHLAQQRAQIVPNNEITILSYINRPSFAYIDDDDAYETYWTAVKNDNGIR